MSELEEIPLESGPDADQRVKVFLWRLRNEGRPPVLLLHGASANHKTFRAPGRAGPGPARCLADWLHENGYEPWLLDWRGSGRVVDGARIDRTLETRRHVFDFDHSAAYDVPLALETIAAKTRARPISAVGHCMGAASLAQSIAKGYVGPKEGLAHVVLLAIGLYYRPALDTQVKIGDRLLERLESTEPSELAIDPRPDVVWPRELEDAYGHWPGVLPHSAADPNEAERICNRVTFMYGPPYRHETLDSEVHRDGFLKEQFGGIPIRMFIHAAQNVRRGWAAEYNSPKDDKDLIGPAAQAHFSEVARSGSVTLITGARNQLWHRSSIDLMYEWLKRGRGNDRTIRKIILDDYAHQDLLWGANAHAEVFPEIKAGLPPDLAPSPTPEPPSLPPSPSPGSPSASSGSSWR